MVRIQPGHFGLASIVCLCLGLNSDVSAQKLDHKLRILLDAHQVKSLDAGDKPSDEKVALGQALFFDRELSGNRDTSCATCHHPQLASGDGLSLPVGTAPQVAGKIGFEREKGHDREFVPRNAPEVFNRGSKVWTSMFWDSRIVKNKDGTFVSPAGQNLLPGLDSVLSIQAMFPVTSRDEMRGRIGDLAFDGQVNEIALVDDADLKGIWNALMDRLLAIESYRLLFQAAYPEKDLSQMTFAQAAEAIADFEIDAFTMLDSPFDQYLAGDNQALSASQKQGALLFFGKAKCANCHNGPLLTDQKHWNLGVPQLGPGKAQYAPRDPGRLLETGNLLDSFAFRTPPLRNVEKTGPYFHNGAYRDLEEVIRHHTSPVFSLLTYWPEFHMDQPELWSTVLDDLVTRIWLISTLDRNRLPRGNLRQNEVDNIVAFLNSLTSPDFEQRMESVIPETVPSGLPVERMDQ